LTHDAPAQLDPDVVADAHARYGESLYRFALGVLRDHSLAEEAVQNAFAKLVEKGGDVAAESRKSWLFRVAYHEAMALRRRQAIGDKAIRLWARGRDGASPGSDVPLVRQEAVEAVRAMIARLPPEQRRVVVMRIYEEKTFAEIAEETNAPLGTVLGRMRAAMKKLREGLKNRDL